MTLEQFFGDYQGKGDWHEINGKSAGYRVEQRISAVDNGFELWMKHQHADGSVPELTFLFSPSVNNLFHVHAFGNEVGHGFALNDTLRFYLDNKNLKADLDSITEISYRLVSSTEMECYGSSTKNSAGNYIMWYETLTRRQD